MIRYKIGTQYLDQFDKEEFAVTKEISKIGEINLRHGDYSTTFKVPLTTKNVEILRFTTELNSRIELDNFDRYNGILLDGDAVISEGYYQVTGFSATKKEAELRFFGGNTDWFDLLKDRYINIPITNQESQFPYNLDDANHLYNVSNIVSSWTESNNLDYFYFLNNNGKNNVRDVVNETIISDWRCGIFESFIFYKIFESVGINLEGTLFNDPIFYQTIIPFITDIETAQAVEYNRTYQVDPFTQNINGNDNFAPINFNIGAYDTRWNGSTYTADADGDFIIDDIRISFAGSSVDGATTCAMEYRVNAGSWNLVPLNLEVTPQTTGSWSFSLGSSITIPVTQNDTVSFRFSQSLNEDRILFNSSGWSDKTFIKYEVVPTQNELNVSVSNYLPKIKQTDFVKDIMFRLGVVSQYDPKTKTLKLDKYEDIENNISNAPNWSNKIDLSKDIEIDYTKILSNYYKKSTIDFKEDSNDIYNELVSSVYGYALGRGLINIENDFLDDESSIYESPYSVTTTVRSFTVIPNNPNLDPEDGEFWIPYLPSNKINGVDENGDAIYESNEIEARVLLVNYETEVQGFATNDDEVILDGNGYNNVGYAWFLKPLLGNKVQNPNELDPIDDTLAYSLPDPNTSTVQTYTGNPLIQRNFNLFTKILNAPFYVSLYMNLKPLDVQNVDFLTPIYLAYKYDQGHYAIDSIEQYKGDGSTTKINLIKI